MKSYKMALILLLLLLVACEQKLTNNPIFIQSLSNDESFDLPLYNESLLILIKKDSTVYVSSLRKLFMIKQKYYKKFKNFDNFLVEVINGDLLSKATLLEASTYKFTINPRVKNEFEDKGLQNLKDIFCESANSKNKFYVKSGFTQDIKLSVLYFFFKSNYYVMQNDYSGKYVLINKN